VLSPDGNTVAVAAPGSAFLTALGQNPVILFGLDGTNTMQAPPSFATATAAGAFGGIGSVSAPPTAKATATPTGTFSGTISPSPVSAPPTTATAVGTSTGPTAVAPNGAVPQLGGPDSATDAGSSAVLLAANRPGITSNQAIAVAFDLVGDLLVQTREPAQLLIIANQDAVLGSPTAVKLSDASRDDSGHDIFHTGAGALIACASCHPEGGDDGFVWTLNGDLRRTPSMRGTIEGTAPYHWPGDEANFSVLTNDVYTNRMAGGPLEPAQLSALQGWVQTIPAPPAPSWVDAAAAARGQVPFERSDTGCSTCHSGAKFTNNETLDVGTGGAFQVPPLVGVSWRFPFLHDGCAQTLAERFALDGGCDTPAHGTTSQLSAQDLSDLIAYLESI
jgi:mono/diheme cytochrome c family protein